MRLSQPFSSIAVERRFFDRMAPLLILIASCLLYLVNLGRAPYPDELYHVLAARGLLEHGEPRIAEGLYTRGVIYTWLVSRAFVFFGETLAAARLPSLLAISVLNTLLFIWLRKEAGMRAAIIATCLFAISPFSIEIAQFSRFYSLQSLSLFVGAILLYETVCRPRLIDPRTIATAIIAAACLSFAVYLQPTALFGVVGLAVWLITAIAIPWLINPKVAHRRKLLIVSIGLLVFAVLVALALSEGLVADLWYRYRWAPLWNAPTVDAFWYYHVYYLLFYPTLWPVIGLLSFAALARWPRPAWFAIVLFVTGFLLSSLAGPKSTRYLVYAQPFIFIIIGLGLAVFFPLLRRILTTLKRRLEGHLAGIGLARRRLPDVFLWGSLLIVLIMNSALIRSMTLLSGITVPPEFPPVQWAEARSTVQPLLSSVDVVVTMAELETLYFWERYDVLFSPSRLTEFSEQQEFVIDRRTGRPVISTLESVRRIVNCTARGIFVAPTRRWHLPEMIDVETRRFIVSHMLRIELPASSELMVFRWESQTPPMSNANCGVIHELLPAVDGR